MKDKLKYNKYKKQKEIFQKKINIIASIRLIIFFVMLISFIGKYYYYPNLLGGIFFISLAVFIILIFIHDKYYKIYDYYQKYINIIEKYIKRENGEWKSFQDKGDDFLESSPFYYRDLDIFGDYSLFQYLSICQTMGGREKLKERLSNKEVPKDKLFQEQESIQEIVNNLHFIMEFQVALSVYEEKKISLSETFNLIKEQIKNNKLDVIIAIICSSICIILLLLALFGIIGFGLFQGMFIFNYFMSNVYTGIYDEEFSKLEKFVTSYKGINDIFQCINSQKFTSQKLVEMQNTINDSVQTGNILKKLDAINSLRNNILASFFANGFFCINLLLLDKFRNFVNGDLSNLQKGISYIEELESMISVSNIGIIFHNKCVPSLKEKVEIHFENIIHPLLGEKKCVPNNFSSKNGVNIITGSNMGGKTSFLRTLGINLILMNSGTYVCATEFSACYFKIFTSMRVNDDIANGISTFYGELLRIKDMVEYVNKGNMLVLIDEIFKGTNYQDRIYGAKEVIKKLNTKQTIVMLTTHDFELCEEKNVVNYHVQEFYENDKIVFDYKIRKGQCNSTNARYLMTKLGIIEK